MIFEVLSNPSHSLILWYSKKTLATTRALHLHTWTDPWGAIYYRDDWNWPRWPLGKPGRMCVQEQNKSHKKKTTKNTKTLWNKMLNSYTNMRLGKQPHCLDTLLGLQEQKKTQASISKETTKHWYEGVLLWHPGHCFAPEQHTWQHSCPCSHHTFNYLAFLLSTLLSFSFAHWQGLSIYSCVWYTGCICLLHAI